MKTRELTTEKYPTTPEFTPVNREQRRKGKKDQRAKERDLRIAANKMLRSVL